MLYYILLPIAWLLWHIGFRIQVIGRENLIRDRGFILAPNHVSAIDPVFVIIARFWGKKMRVFAKRELFEINAFLTWFFRQMGGVAVRGAGKDEKEVVDRTIEECRAGRGLLIFPEGTRTKDGAVGSPKSGAFVVAAAAGVDLIPCRILYDTPDGRMRLFCRVRVVFGEPIPAAALAMEGKRDIKKLKAAKQLLVQRWDELYQRNHFPERKSA